MNSIDITGPADSLQGLLLISGLDPLPSGAQQIDATNYLISAFATDDAITALRTRAGVTVTVIQDNAALSAHDEQVQTDIAAAEAGPPVS
jgi:hypothetical protein